MEKTNKFAAIDFEHLTPNQETACAVGIVKVINSRIVQEFYSLIKPASDERKTLNTHVHGITEEMCADAPTFAELLPIMEYFVGDCHLVAHNHGTEKAVLEKACNYYGKTDSFLYHPEFIDTYTITGKNLEDSCKEYKVELEEHHNALEDARACAELYLKLGGDNIIKPKPGTVSRKGHQKRDSSLNILLPDEELCNTDNPFYHKHIIVTGTFDAYPVRNDLIAKLQKLGANNHDSVIKSTEIAIIGKGAGPSKMEKLAKMPNVRIIYEDKLMEILKSIGIA